MILVRERVCRRFQFFIENYVVLGQKDEKRTSRIIEEANRYSTRIGTVYLRQKGRPYYFRFKKKKEKILFSVKEIIVEEGNVNK